MQGLELSRRFYADVVQPWLSTAAPGLSHSAALTGNGSEALGFDDETSKDHDWGPRVQIYVSRKDFDRHARRLVAEFSAACPHSFLGEAVGMRSRPSPYANGEEAAGAPDHGLEFHTIESRLESHIDVRSVDELTPLQWLGFSEQKLLAFTAGEVFVDDDGRLERARRALAYYPDDVWLYRIACQWRRIHEEHAFVGRTGQVGDDLGSRLVAGRLARDVMRMGFLLERQYAPYAKWFGSAFARLPISEVLTPHLARALAADDWLERNEALVSAYLELAHLQRELQVGAFEPIVGPFHGRPFETINTDDAISAAVSGIVDPDIRALPIMGALDQVTDLTPVLVSASSSRRMMEGLVGADEIRSSRLRLG